jgi:hypothetical protein
LQGVPSFKQSTGLFEIHPLPSAQSVRVFRRLRTASRALPLTRQPFFTRMKAENGFAILLSNRGNGYFGTRKNLLLFHTNKMKARSGTKTVVISY